MATLRVWTKRFVKNAEKKFDGFFLTGYGNEAEGVHKYTFPDGRVYCEHVQVSFSGDFPWYWFALKDEEGHWLPQSVWTQKEIDGAIERIGGTQSDRKITVYIFAVRDGDSQEVREVNHDHTDYGR